MPDDWGKTAASGLGSGGQAVCGTPADPL